MTRSDNRLDDLPMTPIACERCEAVVHVRKASWHQTSIQWDATSLGTCQERQDGENSVRFDGAPTCAALRASIDRAAVNGELMVAQS